MAQALRSTNCGIAAIRPRHVFNLMKPQAGNTVFQAILPTINDGRGGLTFLETAIVVALLKITNPKAIFEFGTFMGATTITLAMNSPDSARITTLDIAPEELAKIQLKDASAKSAAEEDNAIRDLSAQQSGIIIDQADSAAKAKITRIWQNSLTLDTEQRGYRRNFDFIFVDGGHDYRTVKNDTEKALEMMRSDHSIIVWHDFNSALHAGVKQYVSEFAKDRRVMHVGDTMIAFYCPGIEQSFS
ncbi:MAG: class I SAM-dependent methyltransferase [Alphaproteobacteria bacterium]